MERVGHFVIPREKIIFLFCLSFKAISDLIGHAAGCKMPSALEAHEFMTVL